MYIVPKIEVREAEDIIDFATAMDTDMKMYQNVEMNMELYSIRQ